MNTHADVIIVGAGPVGLLTAVALAQEKLSVLVLEADAVISNAPRAAVYFPSTLAVLDELGMLEDVAAQSVKGISFATRVPEFNFIAEIRHEVMRGITYDYQLHCGQDEIAKIAMRHAEALGVEVRFNNKVTDLQQSSSGVTLTVETPEGSRELRGSWVIGADGARSTVRRLLGQTFDGHTWENRFVATNVYCDFTKHGYCPANIIADPLDAGVVMAIDKKGLWRVTYQEDASFPAETHRDRIPGRYANILPPGEPYEIVSSNPYTIHQRAASSFRVGRTFLAGDSAHATNPLGGLGLTGGIWDGMILADLIAAVMRNEAKDEVFDKWAAERRRVFWEVASAGASENKRMVEEKDLAKRKIDMENMRATAENPELSRLMMLYPFRLIGDVIRPDSRWADADPTGRIGLDFSERRSQFL
ncbi:FAD-dependent oxidoreductase [Pseudomonas mediterranea]|uniref:FAD-dependent oxidoreductase n=1 Tax=Pseudomonas TaxID=286 RepID=UPI0013187971|nr:FAD-dependent oxidoreductase [Pseudomonas mediterranea]QHA82192.1 FAD-dependent oxidoreductase [Pseudomonas mediterranea]